MTTTRRASIQLGWLGAAALACGSGCAIAREPGHVESDLACAPRELRSAWWSEGALQANGHGSHLVVLAGDGDRAGLFDLFHDGVLRLSDGQLFSIEAGDPETAGIRFVRPALTTDASGRSDFAGASEIRDTGRDTAVRVVPWFVPRDAEHTTGVTAVVTTDMSRAFLLEATSVLGSTEARYFLRRIDLATPERDATVELGVTEREPFGVTSFWVDEAHDVAFVAFEADPEDDAVSLVRVARDGVTARTTLRIPLTERLLGVAHVGAPPTRILDLVATSDGTSVLIAGRDGALHVLDAQTLEPAGEASPLGVVVANEDTYLPSIRSPLALSAHDRWLASVDLEGRVVVTDRESGEVAARLESAAPPRPPTDWERAERAPMAIRFLADGVLVVTDDGIERFRCAGI